MAQKNPFNINLSKSKIEHSLAVLEKMTHEASGFNVGSAARTVDQVVRVISKVLGEGRQAELHDLNLIRDLTAAVDRWSASESNHERQGIYYHFILILLEKLTAFSEAGGAVKAMSGAEYTQRQRKIVMEALETVGFEELPHGTYLHMVEKFTVQLDELLEGMPKDPSKLSGGPVALAMKCTAAAVGVSSKQIEKIKSAAKGKDGYSWLRNRSQIQQSYTVREVLLEALSQPLRAFRGIWGWSDLDKKIDKLDKLIVTSAREEITDKFAPMRAQSMTRKERSAVLEEANLAKTKQSASIQATPNSAPLPRGPQT